MSQEVELNVAPGPAGVRDEVAAPLAAARLSGESALRLRKQRTLWGDAWRQFRHHHLAMAGTVVLVIFGLATLIAPFIYPYQVNDPFAFATDAGPSWTHLMGTDSLGQDVLARVLWGGRVSLSVGLVAATIAIVLGTTIGAIAGFFGSFVDSVLMRFTDMFISLPQLPLLLLITFLFKDSVENVFNNEFGSKNLGDFVLIVGVIGALNWMPVARLVRAGFLSVKEKEYVEAARSVGATRSSLIFKHILPNTLSPIIVAATLGVGAAIITESALSFLGLGFPSDVPTWGRLLYDAQNYLQLAPHEAIFPGMMIFITVLSINYIGDGLRDALDPHKTV